MADVSRAALWLYRQTRRTGLLDTPIATRLFALLYGQYKRHLEDPFYNLTRRHPELFAGGHIIDVGANIGYTAGVFAACVATPFSVWAYEPSSENFARLMESLERRRLKNVIAQRAAVGERTGVADLTINPDHPGDHHLPYGTASPDAPVERVTLTTVDDEVRAHAIEPVAFIKIDVQGHELAVCRGMTRTIERNPTAAIVVEYMPALLQQCGIEPAEFAAFFAERGYRAFALSQRGALTPLSSLPATLPPPGYADILFTRATIGAGGRE